MAPTVEELLRTSTARRVSFDAGHATHPPNRCALEHNVDLWPGIGSSARTTEAEGVLPMTGSLADFYNSVYLVEVAPALDVAQKLLTEHAERG